MKKTRKVFLTVLSVLTIAAVSLGAASCGLIEGYFPSNSSTEESSSDIPEPMGTEGIVYRISSEGTYAEVVGYEGTATEVKIADTYEGLPVTTIAYHAFYQNETITSVIIPDSVTSIGSYAFALCGSLTFQEYGNCQYLGNEENPYFALIQAKTVNYGSYTIHDNTKVIADKAFYYCTYVRGIVISDGVTSIGQAAFAYCSSLTSVAIPDSVTRICNDAFFSCRSLTNVEIPDGVTSIGSHAFAWCSSLTSLAIPDNLTSIGSGAFYKCSSLTSMEIPDGVTSIGENAFCECDSLTSVVISDGVTSIGWSAFYKCSSLTRITVSTGNGTYRSIDGNLYTKDGKELIQYAIGKTATSFIIPDSVTSIGENAFSNCSNLTSIYYQGTASEWSAISINLGNSPLTNATRYYYSETEPTEEGNYWHYVDGVPTVW